MAKLTLADISNILTAATTIDNNNTLIEAAIENTLSRDGTAPNAMNANLDMNNNRIYNLPDAVDEHEPVTLRQIQDVLAGLDDLDAAVAAAQAAEAGAETAEDGAQAAQAGAEAAQAAAEAAAAEVEAALDTKLDIDAGNVVSPSTVRTNLGLGNSATLDVGTTAGTVAAGDVANNKYDKTGGLISGDVKVAGEVLIEEGTGEIRLLMNKGGPGVSNNILGLQNSITHWTMQLSNTSGGDFALHRHNDTGIFIDTPLIIDRGTAQATYTGRWLNSVTGTGTAPAPSIEHNIVESFDSGVGFYIPQAILSTKTGGVGHREALHIEQHSSASTAGEFVVAMQGQARITAGSGSAFALAGYVWVDAAADASTEAGGAEFNTDIRRPIVRKAGIQVVDVASSTSSGTVIDCGILVAKQPGGVGYNTGLQFGYGPQGDGHFPVFASGQLISCSPTPVVLNYGINFIGLGAANVGAFVCAAGTNGLAFGGSHEGGVIKSGTTSNGAQLNLQSGYLSIDNGGLNTWGIRSRTGFNGSYGSNWISFYYNAGLSRVQLYVDDNLVGEIVTD